MALHNIPLETLNKSILTGNSSYLRKLKSDSPIHVKIQETLSMFDSESWEDKNGHVWHEKVVEGKSFRWANRRNHVQFTLFVSGSRVLEVLDNRSIGYETYFNGNRI